MKNIVKGYKATDENGQCRGFQFEVGQTYKISGKIEICSNGFHFCENLFDVYNYYDKSEKTRLFEIEAVDPIKEGDKSCTGEVRIVRELSDRELLKAWINRTNSGYYNSGDRNSGNRNSGNRNSGDYNSGDYNSGYRNSGDYNSGYYNSGYRNSGNRNSGNRNSGDYNSGDYNSGFFNSNTPYVRLFNKKTKLRWDSDTIYKLRCLPVKPILQWVDESNMSDEEKQNNPSYKTTGGYLKNTGKMDWSEVLNSEEHVRFIESLPNFNDEVFKQVTGHSLYEVIKRKGE